jgi:hypothetical protein
LLLLRRRLRWHLPLRLDGVRSVVLGRAVPKRLLL